MKPEAYKYVHDFDIFFWISLESKSATTVRHMLIWSASSRAWLKPGDFWEATRHEKMQQSVAKYFNINV